MKGFLVAEGAEFGEGEWGFVGVFGVSAGEEIEEEIHFILRSTNNNKRGTVCPRNSSMILTISEWKVIGDNLRY
jgi:hypothetical protein